MGQKFHAAAVQVSPKPHEENQSQIHDRSSTLHLSKLPTEYSCLDNGLQLLHEVEGKEI